MCAATLIGSTSILTLTRAEVWLCVVLSVVVIALFVVFYDRIFRGHLRRSLCGGHRPACGPLQPADRGGHRVIIVLAMNLVGSLLISALFIFPALSGHAAVQELPAR